MTMKILAGTMRMKKDGGKMTSRGTTTAMMRLGTLKSHQQNKSRMMQKMTMKTTTKVMAKVAVPWALAAQFASANGMLLQHVL